MARTKQTARKSSGGKAPRKQLASTSPSQFRSYMSSAQSFSSSSSRDRSSSSSSSSSSKKTIFVNSESTFYQFAFEKEKEKEKDFVPSVSCGRVRHFLTQRDETYMKVNFLSRYDGSVGFLFFFFFNFFFFISFYSLSLSSSLHLSNSLPSSPSPPTHTKLKRDSMNLEDLPSTFPSSSTSLAPCPAPSPTPMIEDPNFLLPSNASLSFSLNFEKKTILAWFLSTHNKKILQ